MKSILTIAQNTVLNYSRDRIFYSTIFFSFFFIGMSFLLAAFTYVETIKTLLDFGLAAISISGIIFAIFLGIGSISREIETKVIYNILSKPISRTSYVLGKYLGCAVVLSLSYIFMSFSIIFIVKQMGVNIHNSLYYCLFLSFLESLLILAIALFASLFSSTILAASFTISVFLIGRNLYSFKLLAEMDHPPLLQKSWLFFYYIFPNLERFNLRPIAAYAKEIPEAFVFHSALYFCCFLLILLSLSCFTFYKRELP